MKKLVMILLVTALMLACTSPERAFGIFLPDGTVTADRQDSGTGSGWWWGETVTTVTIDAQNVEPGQVVVVSGKITGISPFDQTTWAEIGLIQKDAWDYWQTAFGGSFKSAVFDKGLYVVHWTEATGTGLQLKEGWWEGGNTFHLDGPYAWDLAAPTAGSPWEFIISMYPTTSGDAYLSVIGETIYGTQPLAYSGARGYGDFGESYLIAQIWSATENAYFSFSDVQADVFQSCTLPEECDDGNPCTDEECVEGHCEHTNNTKSCDDEEPCTMNDACSDGMCSGDPLDADGDTFVSDACEGGTDCDDSNPFINPGATESPYLELTCFDLLDNDCDGQPDAGDPDCSIPCGCPPSAEASVYGTGSAMKSGALAQVALFFVPVAQIFFLKRFLRRKR